MKMNTKELKDTKKNPPQTDNIFETDSSNTEAPSYFQVLVDFVIQYQPLRKMEKSLTSATPLHQCHIRTILIF